MPVIYPQGPQGLSNAEENGKAQKKPRGAKSVSWAFLIVFYIISLLVVVITTAFIVYFVRKANEIDIVSADESDAASSPVITNPPTPGPNSQLIDVGYNLGTVSGRVLDNNGVYVDALSDPMSEAYEEMEGDVCHNWTDIYEDLGFHMRECYVDNFSRGSLIYDLRLVVSDTELLQDLQNILNLGEALNATRLAAGVGLTAETSEVTATSRTFLVSGKGHVYDACRDEACSEICRTHDPASFSCHCFNGDVPSTLGACSEETTTPVTGRYIEDITLGRPAYQSSTSPGFYASVAVDGNPLTCSSTLNTAAPWWGVDMGRREAIVLNVTITNTPINGARLHDVIIGVTNVAPMDGMQITPDQFTVDLCARINSPVPNGATVTVQCPHGGVTGRYLVVQLDHGSVSNGLDTYLALCEVQAYGYA